MRFHGSDTYFCHIEGRKQKWKNWFFEKQAVRNSNAYIAPTTFAGDTSAELFNLKHENIEVIPYGLVLSDFDNPASSNAFLHGAIDRLIWSEIIDSNFARVN